MEPNNTPQPELAPSQPTPEFTNADSEVGAQVTSPEREAPRAEGQPKSAAHAAPSIPLPQVVPPVAPITAPVSSQAVGDDSTNPVVADDVDVIEKEWVDKAKAIVSEYKHDPHTQEIEAGKLQADYLKKRFGKDVKASA